VCHVRGECDRSSFSSDSPASGAVIVDETGHVASSRPGLRGPNASCSFREEGHGLLGPASTSLAFSMIAEAAWRPLRADKITPGAVLRAPSTARRSSPQTAAGVSAGLTSPFVRRDLHSRAVLELLAVSGTSLGALRSRIRRSAPDRGPSSARGR